MKRSKGPGEARLTAQGIGTASALAYKSLLSTPCILNDLDVERISCWMLNAYKAVMKGRESHGIVLSGLPPFRYRHDRYHFDMKSSRSLVGGASPKFRQQLLRSTLAILASSELHCDPASSKGSCSLGSCTGEKQGSHKRT